MDDIKNMNLRDHHTYTKRNMIQEAQVKHKTTIQHN